MARPPLPIGAHGKISVREVRDNVFRARTRFRDSDGVTREVTATARTAPAAERELKRVLTERTAPGSGKITATMKMPAAAKEWLALIEQEGTRESSTIAEYKRTVKNVIDPHLAHLRVREMTPGQCERFINSQQSDAARRRAKTALSMILGAAVRDGALATNPIASTTRLKTQKREIRALTMEDLQAVRQAVATWMETSRPGPKASTDLRDVIDLMLATGCRIGEVLALRWVDIDMLADTPTLTVSGTIKTEKGRGTYRKPRPKTDNGLRTLELPPFAVDMLLRRRVEQPQNRYNAVFATRNGTWHQVSNMERRWRQVRTEAGLDWVKPHSFRKTVATLIDRLADSQTAARQLGHGSTRVVEQFYVERDRSAPQVSAILQAFLAPQQTAEDSGRKTVSGE